MLFPKVSNHSLNTGGAKRLFVKSLLLWPQKYLIEYILLVYIEGFGFFLVSEFLILPTRIPCMKYLFFISNKNTVR